MRRYNFLIFLLLLSASVTVILRFVLYKYGEAMSPDVRTALSAVSVVSVFVLLITAFLFISKNKKAEKNAQNENREKEI